MYDARGRAGQRQSPGLEEARHDPGVDRELRLQDRIPELEPVRVHLLSPLEVHEPVPHLRVVRALQAHEVRFPGLPRSLVDGPVYPATEVVQGRGERAPLPAWNHHGGRVAHRRLQLPRVGTGRRGVVGPRPAQGGEVRSGVVSERLEVERDASREDLEARILDLGARRAVALVAHRVLVVVHEAVIHHEAKVLPGVVVDAQGGDLLDAALDRVDVREVVLGPHL